MGLVLSWAAQCAGVAVRERPANSAADGVVAFDLVLQEDKEGGRGAAPAAAAASSARCELGMLGRALAAVVRAEDGDSSPESTDRQPPPSFCLCCMLRSNSAGD